MKEIIFTFFSDYKNFVEKAIYVGFLTSGDDLIYWTLEDIYETKLFFFGN